MNNNNNNTFRPPITGEGPTCKFPPAWGQMIQSAPANLNKRRTTGYKTSLIRSFFGLQLCIVQPKNLFSFNCSKIPHFFNYGTLTEYYQFHEASKNITALNVYKTTNDDNLSIYDVMGRRGVFVSRLDFVPTNSVFEHTTHGT